MPPRLRCIAQDTNEYAGHVVEVGRQTDVENWYIRVSAPDDGMWRESSEKTRREAVLEARRGAMLCPA